MLTGVRGRVQAVEGDEAAVPESAQVHEDDPSAQVPRGLRSRESHQSRLAVPRSFRKVSYTTYSILLSSNEKIALSSSPEKKEEHKPNYSSIHI